MGFPNTPELEATSGSLCLSQREQQESSGLKMKLGILEWSLCEFLMEGNTSFQSYV